MESRSRAVLVSAGVGVACVLAALGFYAALHFAPPSAELDWSRRTISQYALLENGWWFDAGTPFILAVYFAPGGLTGVLKRRGRLA